MKQLEEANLLARKHFLKNKTLYDSLNLKLTIHPAENQQTNMEIIYQDYLHYSYHPTMIPASRLRSLN